MHSRFTTSHPIYPCPGLLMIMISSSSLVANSQVQEAFYFALVTTNIQSFLT